MLRNVLIVKLAKLYTVNSMYFLSALYTLRYVPIVKMTLVIYFQKKKKNDPFFWYGLKNTKVMPQNPRYLSFLLGKGGILTSPNFTNFTQSSALSALPPACKSL